MIRAAVPFGDRAIRFAVRGSPRERRALSDALRALPNVVDVVVAEEHACVVFEGAPPDVASVTSGAPRVAAAAIDVAEHVVPTVYDGADLEDVARATGMGREQVIETHAASTYEVSFIGFMPGFAYLRGLPDALVLPRRASPRPRVPRGSVAIAAHYAGVYPTESPGGWHLLGRAAHAPAWSTGDRVRFERVDRLPMIVADEPRAPLALGDAEVRSIAGFAHVVGAPRVGHMHEGVPHAGPLVVEAFAQLGTRTAIEVFGTLKIGDRVVASGPDARVAYVGLAVDAPIGSRIARGDRLSITDVALPAKANAKTKTNDDVTAIAVRLGPDEGGEALLGATFRIAPTSNRVGTRLEGPALAVRDVPSDTSTPMVKGAIERTPSGLVVLGPDHPTTGGYPVVAVLRDAAMDAFYMLPVGARVQFTTE